MSGSITMEAPGSPKTAHAFLSYRQTLIRILLFIALPLFLEFVAYLIEPEIFPAYLPASTNVLNLSIGFLLIAAALSAFSILLAFLIRPFPIHIEWFAPPAFFFLFLTLSLNRLLPAESGFSIPRILVFAVSLMLAVGAHLLLKSKPFRLSRLVLANAFYVMIAAYMLPFLFRFPLQNWLTALIIHTALFASLLFVPLKIIVALLVFLIVVTGNRRTPISRFAPPNKLAPYQRVILIGIDGFSPDVTSSMVNEGISGRLHTLAVPYSPLVWNTIYTGATPQQHGVMSFTATAFPGSKAFLSLWLDHWTNSDWNHKIVGMMKRADLIRTLAPARSKYRLQPALWNIVDQNGAESLVIGGWTTYPPEKIRGTYISDYAFSVKSSDADGTYYPPDPRIRSLLQTNSQTGNWPADIQRYVTRDERVHRLSLELMKSASPSTRFMFVYYSAVDAFGHHLGTYINRNSTPAERKAELVSVRDQLYRKMNGYINDYKRFVDEGTLLIVCSDHGFYYDKRQHNYPVDGTLLMFGKGVRNLEIEGSVYDIAPTILYALGLSPSEIFHGSPLKQAFDGIIPQPATKRYLPGRSFYESQREKALEEEKLEELKDLQYINR